MSSLNAKSPFDQMRAAADGTTPQPPKAPSKKPDTYPRDSHHHEAAPRSTLKKYKDDPCYKGCPNDDWK